MRVWRFFLSGYSSPFTNMAVDRAMIDIHRKDNIPVFRIYGWSPHSFSTGYSQKIEEVLDITACVRDGVPFVRRHTGGGIIFHGDEVTYSLVCSSEDIGSPATVKDGYKTICSFILNAYRHYGLSPAFAVESGQINREKSTLCFASFEDYDILSNGKKIGGNAQKRTKNVIMQHGSIPLTLDYAPVLKYVKEKVSFQKTTAVGMEIGREIGFEEFADVLKDSFVKTFGVRIEERDLTTEEQEIVEIYERQLIQENNYLIGNR
ncbi:MAG: lipoate--protein ligase family protein [Candidatus Ratteibacteria bacterium]|nr:lipoate--protein ligase family protein [Candidatus Ratteibacteria bacterium]